MREEERLSYFVSLERHAVTEYSEVRSLVALKRGVGDHTAERFAEHEQLGSWAAEGIKSHAGERGFSGL
jgi:hypothetical protein